jgi:hypothetical protein
MAYYVMCRVSDGAAARESLLTRHGVPVVFRTRGEAEATAEDLRHERQQHPRGTADYHYWVVECMPGENAASEAHSSFP